MKKINLFKIGINLFGLIFMMTLFAGISAVLSGAAGVVVAVTGAVIASDPVTVEDVKAGSADLDTDYISKVITEMRPAATPLDTILRNINKDVKIESFKSDFYSVSTRPLYDTVNTAYVSQGDGATSYALKVDTPSMWTVDDTCLFRGVLGVDGLDLLCLVIDKSVTNSTITIQPMNGFAGSGSQAGNEILPTAGIAKDIRIVRCGPAKNELDAQTSPYAIIPVKDYNYMQIFMAQVEESVFQKMHSKEVQWNFKDYQVQSIYDMRATMEFSFLFGYRKQVSDLTSAKERYLTGGMWRSITKDLEYGTGGTDRTIDNSTFVDWTKSLFTGNSGADTRFLFAGDGLMANLAKVDTIIKQIEAKQTETKFGITFNQIETNFGKILIKHHPLLDQANYGDYGIVLDLNHVEKHVMKPMSTRPLSLRDSGQRNVDAVVIEETCGVILTYPDTHAIISPKA